MTNSPGTLRRPVHPALAFAAALVVAVAMMAVWSSRSEAAVICVTPVPVDPDPEGCQATFDTGPQVVQGALDLAKITFQANEIRIYPGTYTGNFAYDASLHNDPLTIVGMGTEPEDTTLTMGNSTGSVIGLDVQTVPGSVIRNLTYSIPANADGNLDVGLFLGNVTADEIVVSGPVASNAAAIRCDDCNVTDSTIDLPTNTSTIGVDQYGGSASVADSTIRADFGVRHSSSGLTTTVERSRIKAHIGAIADNGRFAISNTLFQLDDEANATGVELQNSNAGNGLIEAELDGLTIINGAGSNSVGIRAAVNNLESVDATLTNSVITGFNSGSKTLVLSAADNRTVKFHSDYSAYDNGETSQLTGPNGGTLDYSLGANHSDLPDGVSFADPQSGDFTPSILGGLRDAGDPADPGTGALDINGNQRACHGTDEGIIRRDIGAFEFKSDPLDDCTYPETTLQVGPSILLPGAGPSFGFFSDKNPATFLCSWDGQPEIACDAVLDAPMLGYGAHNLSVRAKDQFGNIDQTPATHDYTVEQPDPTCLDDPSLCPPDKTAPRVIEVKVAKKTKAQKIKVRFKSNEAGAKFKCKLNGAKWRTCKSPWKTPKLRKGKNVIRIQATDKAGNRSKVVKRVVKKTRKRK